MASRRLLAIVLVVLAVAWPVAADDASAPPPSDDPGAAPPSESPEGSAPSDPGSSGFDPWTDCFLFVGCPEAQQESASDEPPTDDSSCRPYGITMPGPNTPVTEVFSIDPDGCIRAYLRRTVGWPPGAAESTLHISMSDVLPW